MPGHPFRFRSEHHAIGKDDRTRTEGDFVPLAQGIVHYQSANLGQGTPVVLVHGFSVPYYIWDPTFEALKAAGRHVLRYDLYGRGLSDRPDTDYDQDLYDRQLADLIDALCLPTPVDLVGLSMGAAIAAVFCERHPAQVRRLALIGPAGQPMKTPALKRLLEVPGLGEALLDRFGDAFLIGSIRKDLADPLQAQQYTERFREQMRLIGFKHALLSTLRKGMLTGAARSFAAVGGQDRPVLVIWGTKDRVVPFALNERLRQAVPQAELLAVAEAGHIVHYERPEIVNPHLIRFLSG